jgi:hypothetical protein
MKKMVNGELLDMTADEITQRQTDEAAEPSDADRALAVLRAERDKRLAETDWTANSDVTMTAAMTTYRQALRDITDNATSLDDVTWPTKP